MSPVGDGRDFVRSRRWIREHLVIVRHSRFGSLECETCKCPALTQAELAEVLGISVSTLARFLQRKPVRADISRTIRDHVKAVRE